MNSCLVEHFTSCLVLVESLEVKAAARASDKTARDFGTSS